MNCRLTSILAVASLLAFGCDNAPPGDDAGTTDAAMTDGGGVDSGPPAATCTDGLMNQDESDVDCGGTCGATCTPGDMCTANGDCTTDDCGTDGTCQPLATCTDGAMNGTETDVDCGGTMCMGCADGDMCTADGDCTSAFCSGSVCTAPVCGNGTTEGPEDCDDGTGGTPAETATCDIDCSGVMCGDGVVNATALEACDGDGAGTGGETATCNADCSVASCGDGVVNATAGEACDGDGAGTGGETATCNADCSAQSCGDMIVNTTAGEQCDDGNTDDTDACSNSCTINGPSITLTADATFDTDTGELDGVVSTGWDAASHTLYVADLSIPTGFTLTVTGSNPFLLVSAGNISVVGDIDVSGQNGGAGPGCNMPGAPGGAAGPGGGAGGDGGGIGLVSLSGTPGMGSGAGGAGIDDNAGGGGAGHIALGGDGVADGTGTPGTGGAIYNASVTVEGGSGGGGGSVDDDTPLGIDADDDGGAGGGGGGGGLYFDSMGDITVSGTIDASGGNGGSGSACGSGSGGGGSGGTIVLYATGTVDVSAATLDVSGGVGSAGGSNSGDGADGEIHTGVRPTCADGVQNQDETDLDCGGIVCGGCADGLACSANGDCSSAFCLSGVCFLGTCNNSTMDAMETDVDCGGPDCAPCADGLMCVVSTDCVNECDASLCISCGDGVTNGTETCDDAGLSATCDLDCTAATCGDGTQNGLAGEACDDSNTTPGDGCDATCMREDSTAIAASGSSVMFSGSIEATDPQWARPGATCTSTSPADHYYDFYFISNTTGAAQVLTVTATWAGDGYLHAYRVPFDPTGVAGCITGDDDFGGTGGSQITGLTIAPGETIAIVASTFSGGAAIGAYTIDVATN